MAAPLALLAAALAVLPGPLPDGKTFDAITYAFGFPLGPDGQLSVAADGKVSYRSSSAPHTGSGGIVVEKEWTLTQDEKAELFAKLVEAGLLDLGVDNRTPPHGHGFRVFSGKWSMPLNGVRVPDKVIAVLRPMLAKADPDVWGEKPKPGKPEPIVLTSIGYTLTPKANGEPVSLNVYRNGLVQYRRMNAAHAGDGRYFAVEKEWKQTPKEAEALLDGLVADGLFDLDDTDAGKYPNHKVVGSAGYWEATFHPKDLPEKITKHLLPLLKEADAEFWK